MMELQEQREAEMAKLRKLLEEVHTESEQQIHTLRTKHQTSMMELQEQIERMSRDKEKVVKEKGVMKTEISELYAQIEILQSEVAASGTQFTMPGPATAVLFGFA